MILILFDILVVPAGLEPASPNLGNLYSIPLSYGTMKFGRDDGTRTHIFSPITIIEFRRLVRYAPKFGGLGGS